jgi:ribosome biogenesis GTPase
LSAEHVHQLSALGWDDTYAETFAVLGDHHDLVPARVTRVDRGAADVHAEAGPIRATFAGPVLAAAAKDPIANPCVGDWVAVRDWPDDRVTLEAVLPRRTAFVRATAGGSSHAQVLAANVDIAVIVEPLHPQPEIGRIERLLALAWESGAQPLVVLTKADLAADAEDQKQDIAAAAPGVDGVVVCAVTGEGLDAVRVLAAPRVTLALLGPSGAGKSTLTNALAGVELMHTRALRADGKGRHTTVHRELVRLPGGALLIDTPGLRGVGLTDAGEGLDLVFSDIEVLAGSCRFSDCAHRSEPGCAVRVALDSGELPERRWESYLKLQREARWMAMRHDARLRAEERDRWKRIHKEVRSSGRIRRG